MSWKNEHFAHPGQIYFRMPWKTYVFPRRCNPTTAVFNDPALRGAQDEPAGSLKTAVVGLRVVWGVVVTQVGRGGEGLYALHVFTR